MLKAHLPWLFVKSYLALLGPGSQLASLLGYLVNKSYVAFTNCASKYTVYSCHNLWTTTKLLKATDFYMPTHGECEPWYK